MDTSIGLDAHKEVCQVAVLRRDGIRQTPAGTQYRFETNKQVASTQKALTMAFKDLAGATVLLEASTVSRPIAEWLRAAGMNVIIADPNYEMMYAHRKQGRKTDRADAEALAVALYAGHYRKIHEVSPEQREMRKLLGIRGRLIKDRTEHKNAIYAIYCAEGVKITRAEIVRMLKAVKGDDVSEIDERVRDLVVYDVSIGRSLNKQIDRLDQQIKTTAESSERVKRMTTVPGVGPVVAATFVSVIDDVSRFSNAGQVASYLGLVPRVYASAGKETTGGISKQGSKYLRAVLLQAALMMARSKDPRVKALIEWRDQLAARRGRKLANVALSRRIAEILFAMLRDGTSFGNPKPRRAKSATGEEQPIRQYTVRPWSPPAAVPN